MASKPPKTLQKLETSEMLAAPSSSHASVLRLVESPQFESVTGLIICINAIVIGLGTEHSVTVTMERVQIWEAGGPAVTAPSSAPTVLRVLGYIFALCYLVELALKAYAFRWHFFTGAQRKWNCFDLFLVCAAAYENISDLVSDSGGGGSFLTVMRLLRLLKLLRLVRLMRFFHEIRTMFLCLVGSMGTLFWTVMMMMLIMYIFGLCLLQGAVTCASTPSCIDDDLTRSSLALYWGSVGNAMITLFKAITGGNDWENMVRPIKEAGVFYFGMFLFYILFLQFAVLNVLTGMFVDTAMAVLMGLREDGNSFLEAVARLKEIMKEHSRGHGDAEEFLTLTNVKANAETPEMQMFLLECDIDFEQMLHFYSIVSADGNPVEIDNFLGGCKNTQGLAKSMDMMKVLYEVKHIAKMLSSHHIVGDQLSSGDPLSSHHIVGDDGIASSSELISAINACDNLKVLQGASQRLDAKIRSIEPPLRFMDSPLDINSSVSPPFGEVLAHLAGPHADPPSTGALKALVASLAADLAPRLAVEVELALTEELAPAIARETATLMFGSPASPAAPASDLAVNAAGAASAASADSNANGHGLSSCDEGAGVFSGLARLYLLEALKVGQPISSGSAPRAQRRARHKGSDKGKEPRVSAADRQTSAEIFRT